MSVELVLLVVKLVAASLAFLGAIVGLVGYMIVSLRYQYLKYTAKTMLIAFLGGPLVLWFGDRDEERFLLFKKGVRLYLPLLLLSVLVLFLVGAFGDCGILSCHS